MRDQMNRLIFLLATLLTGLLLTTGTAAAGTVHVSIGEDLPAAVEAASPGDTIVLAPGNYSANLVITKNVSVQGSGASRTLVSAASASEPAIRVERVGGISLKGMAVRDSDVAGIRVRNSEGVSVKDVRASGNAVGILFEDSVGAVVADSEVNGNSGDGIRLRRSAGGQIVNNEISGNTGTGLSIDGSPGTVIRGNEASNNLHGMFVISSSGSVIRNNRAAKNDWNGILVWNSSESTVQDNVALRNRYGVVVEESPGSSTEGNVNYEATSLVLAVLIGFAIAGVTYLTGWHIFRASDPSHAERAARTHRLLGFATLLTYLVVASLALNTDSGLQTMTILGLGLGLYLIKIWSINTGKENLGPLVGSALILKWAGLFLFYVVQV